MPRRSLLRILGMTGLGYAGVTLWLAGCQRSFIYHPATAPEARLLEAAGREGLEPWRNEAGSLIGWRSPAPDGSDSGPALLVFHGNAGQALHRIYLARGFQSMPGGERWTVHLLEYPGYGARPGSPSEAAIREAAREAAELLFRGPFSAIHLAGESLGSGPAAWLAGSFPDKVAGVLLITPFTNLADVGRHHFPFLPVRLFLRENYDNVEALGSYGGPVGFLLAERDEVIPTRLGLRLHESYRGPKKLWIQPGRGHNTLSYDPGDPWWGELSELLQP